MCNTEQYCYFLCSTADGKSCNSVTLYPIRGFQYLWSVFLLICNFPLEALSREQRSRERATCRCRVLSRSFLYQVPKENHSVWNDGIHRWTSHSHQLCSTRLSNIKKHSLFHTKFCLHLTFLRHLNLK